MSDELQIVKSSYCYVWRCSSASISALVSALEASAEQWKMLSVLPVTVRKGKILRVFFFARSLPHLCYYTIAHLFPHDSIPILHGRMSNPPAYNPGAAGAPGQAGQGQQPPWQQQQQQQPQGGQAPWQQQGPPGQQSPASWQGQPQQQQQQAPQQGGRDPTWQPQPQAGGGPSGGAGGDPTWSGGGGQGQQMSQQQQSPMQVFAANNEIDPATVSASDH